MANMSDKTCPKCKEKTNRIYCRRCSKYTLPRHKNAGVLPDLNCKHTKVIPVADRIVCTGCKKDVKPYGGWRLT